MRRGQRGIHEHQSRDLIGMSRGQHQSQEAAVAVSGHQAASSTDHVDQSRQVSHGPFGRNGCEIGVAVAQPGTVVSYRTDSARQRCEHRTPGQSGIVAAGDQDHGRGAGPGLDPAQHTAPEIDPAAGHGRDLAQRLEHQIGHDSARCILITESKS